MADIKSEEVGEKKSLNFIEQIVEKDLKEGKNGGKVQTRFPPEPNGYLHIGHAKAICLDFGIAADHNGICNLRFDDTNPTKEDVEYVEAIKEDIQWLGYQWGNEYYASDYFQQLWDFAIRLIEEGKAYIDEQTSEQIAQQKGTPTQPGVESPYRNRPIEESLSLFKKMNTGEIAEGAMVPVLLIGFPCLVEQGGFFYRAVALGSTPGWEGVPFCCAICSEVCSSIYALPSSMRRMAKSHNCWK